MWILWEIHWHLEFVQTTDQTITGTNKTSYLENILYEEDPLPCRYLIICFIALPTATHILMAQLSKQVKLWMGHIWRICEMRKTSSLQVLDHLLHCVYLRKGIVMHRNYQSISLPENDLFCSKPVKCSL